MSDRPRRYKTVEELAPDEHLAHLRDGRLPETDEYRERRREALEGAGLDEAGDNSDDDDPTPEDMTPDQHFRDLRRDR